jgi:hypothetical protein
VLHGRDAGSQGCQGCQVPAPNVKECRGARLNLCASRLGCRLPRRRLASGQTLPGSRQSTRGTWLDSMPRCEHGIGIGDRALRCIALGHREANWPVVALRRLAPEQCQAAEAAWFIRRHPSNSWARGAAKKTTAAGRECAAAATGLACFPRSSMRLGVQGAAF